jgi:hypothetical protein
MNPRSKNSKNTTIASARKKYGNERTKPQGKKKPHALACATANQKATSTLLDQESHGES